MTTPTPPDTARERSPLVIAAAILAALPVLYVLSVGPMVRLMRQGYMSEEFAIAFYWPLEKLCEACEPLARVIVWYQSLWMPSLSAGSASQPALLAIFLGLVHAA